MLLLLALLLSTTMVTSPLPSCYTTAVMRVPLWDASGVTRLMMLDGDLLVCCHCIVMVAWCQ